MNDVNDVSDVNFGCEHCCDVVIADTGAAYLNLYYYYYSHHGSCYFSGYCYCCYLCMLQVEEVVVLYRVGICYLTCLMVNTATRYLKFKSDSQICICI